MILSYRREDYPVPLTSKCIIHTTGTKGDGDVVSVTSPVFASMNFTSGAINTSDKFDVVLKLGVDETVKLTGNTYGTLHCEDNDTFNMYVSVP
jgi:hypothetical protein